MIYDLIIVGGGPAGLTAGIYAARKKLKTLILTGKPNWQLDSAFNIENYPGFKLISGAELLKNMRDQLNSYGVEINYENVVRVKKERENFKVITNKQEHSARVVIAASGRSQKKLGVPGEEKFRGRGVGYCVTCDGPLFSGKDVAVIGGGNAGLGAALELIRYANKIYRVEITDRFWGDEVKKERLKKSGKAELILNAKTQEIKGEKFVKALVYQDKKTGKIREIKVDGIFVEIGLIPCSGFAGELAELNESGEIIVNPKTNETKTPGFFAAGDATDIPYKQIVIACGEGAKAALSAYNYLLKRA